MESEQTSKKGNGLMIGVSVVVIALIAGGAYFWSMQNNAGTTTQTNTQTTTQGIEEDSLEQISADYSSIEAINIDSEMSDIDKALSE